MKTPLPRITTYQVFSWGSNSNGQLGQGKRTPDQPVPSGVDEAKDKQAYNDFKTLKKKYLFPNKMHLPPGNEGVSRIGSGNEGTYIKRKNPPSPYQNEVSHAGFAYTNKICLAGEECSPILSLSREALA